MLRSCSHCHESFPLDDFRKAGRGRSKICQICEDPLYWPEVICSAVCRFFLLNGWYEQLEQLMEPTLPGPELTRKIKLKEFKEGLNKIFGVQTDAK